MNREETEKLYIKKFTELQVWWRNPVPMDVNFNFIKEWTDERLNKEIGDTVGQLRFEKTVSLVKKFFVYSVIIFVGLGVIGFLVFGFKQLFN